MTRLQDAIERDGFAVLVGAVTDHDVRAMAAEPSKWEITSQALTTALETLPANATVGISYFSNDDMCGVQSTPNVELSKLDTAQRGIIRASLRNVRGEFGKAKLEFSKNGKSVP